MCLASTLVGLCRSWASGAWVGWLQTIGQLKNCHSRLLAVQCSSVRGAVCDFKYNWTSAGSYELCHCVFDWHCHWFAWLVRHSQLWLSSADAVGTLSQLDSRKPLTLTHCTGCRRRREEDLGISFRNSSVERQRLGFVCRLCVCLLSISWFLEKLLTVTTACRRQHAIQQRGGTVSSRGNGRA